MYNFVILFDEITSRYSILQRSELVNLIRAMATGAQDTRCREPNSGK
jgi:hypothetical protein